MSYVLLSARVILALVFIVAGVTKFIDIPGTQKALIGFSLPNTLVKPFSILLPLSEIAIGIALLLAQSAWWGGIGAFLLLVVFIVGIIASLIRGQKPDCHCFGQLYSKPIGASTLIRNGLFIATSLFIIWGSDRFTTLSIFSWMEYLSITQVLGFVWNSVLLSLLALQGWFIFNIVQQNGRLLLRIESLEQRSANSTENTEEFLTSDSVIKRDPIGKAAPPFQLPDVNGVPHTLQSFFDTGKPVVLIFSDPQCGPCNALLPEIALWQQNYSHVVTFVVVSRGSNELNRAKQDQHTITHILLQNNWEVADLYQVSGTPSAILIQSNGTVGSSLCAGREAIHELVQRTVDDKRPSQRNTDMVVRKGDQKSIKVIEQHPIPAIGTPAPPLRAEDISGNTIELAQWYGQSILILFWNPTCGFCRQIAAELISWIDQPLTKPQLLIISSSSIEYEEITERTVPVILDPTFRIGSLYGARGTPSAILIDAQGAISSQLAVGGPAVQNLLMASVSHSISTMPV